MSEIREVRTYGLRHVVSPELAEDRSALEAFMRAEIADQLSREGEYTIVPDSYDLQLVSRMSYEGRILLTKEEQEAGLAGDELVALMTVRCY